VARLSNDSSGDSGKAGVASKSTRGAHHQSGASMRINDSIIGKHQLAAANGIIK